MHAGGVSLMGGPPRVSSRVRTHRGSGGSPTERKCFSVILTLERVRSIASAAHEYEEGLPLRPCSRRADTILILGSFQRPFIRVRIAHTSLPGKQREERAICPPLTG